MNMVKVEYLVPESDKEVHAVAHRMLSETMAAGQASNGIGSFYNRDPLEYHINKGLHHLLRLWHDNNIEAREAQEPCLKHLYNAMTRLVLAEVVHLRSKPEKEVLLPGDEE